MTPTEAPPLKVVFFGTPAFSVPTLNSLLADSRFEVLAVVSQPDRPSGRGQQLQPTPVKTVAHAAGIPVYQPVSIRKDADLLACLGRLMPDVFVTIAFGQILSQAVLAIPRLGTINVHASLLPLYRGANPIQWAVLDGQTETGLTTMLTDIGVDTGDMLLTATTAISPEDTALTVADRLSAMGGPLLIDTLLQHQAGTLQPRPQDHSQATHAPKLAKDDAVLNPQQPGPVVLNRIRGQQPWPGATIQWQADQPPLKVLSASLSDISLPPGQLCQYGDSKAAQLLWGTASQALSLTVIQPAGKKPMPASDWLRGLPAGSIPTIQ
jgi:methionyl-tRNA formyltransferase